MKNPLIPNDYRRPPKFMVTSVSAPQALECGDSAPLSLPQVALSIRQPWAWLIVNGYKTVENRSRNIGNRLGPVLIHASAAMTQDDYDATVLFVSSFDSALAEMIPDPAELDRGGIVGAVRIIDHTDLWLQSEWFTNSGYAYRLDGTKPLPFKPCKGRLGFFPCEYK